MCSPSAGPALYTCQHTQRRARAMRLQQVGLLATCLLCLAVSPARSQVKSQNGWVTILDAKSFKDWKVAPESPSARVEESATEKRVVAGDAQHDGKWTF